MIWDYLFAYFMGCYLATGMIYLGAYLFKDRNEEISVIFEAQRFELVIGFVGSPIYLPLVVFELVRRIFTK